MGASYLTFTLRESHYAVAADAVCEIAPMPALTRLDESPAYIAGVLNLRGSIVPVIDLNAHFGHAPERFRLGDCIVIIEGKDGEAVGIIVNGVQEVRDIAPAMMSALPTYGLAASTDSRFLLGLARLGDQVVMVLDADHLLQFRHALPESPGISAMLVPGGFSPDATPEERAVFLERAEALARRPDAEEQTGLKQLAVVRIGEEFFGFELNAVREFAGLRSVTPVPCCPPHIVGQMSLRGDLITVVDITEALGLPPAHGGPGRQVVVINCAELGAGVLVDDVLDVLALGEGDISPLHAAEGAASRGHLLGSVAHGPRTVSLIDLPALLRHESLIVNEKP